MEQTREEEIATKRAEVDELRAKREAACDRIPEIDLDAVHRTTYDIARLRREIAALEAEV
jgi:hypothetical protein